MAGQSICCCCCCCCTVQHGRSCNDKESAAVTPFCWQGASSCCSRAWDCHLQYQQASHSRDKSNINYNDTSCISLCTLCYSSSTAVCRNMQLLHNLVTCLLFLCLLLPLKPHLLGGVGYKDSTAQHSKAHQSLAAQLHASTAGCCGNCLLCQLSSVVWCLCMLFTAVEDRSAIQKSRDTAVSACVKGPSCLEAGVLTPTPDDEPALALCICLCCIVSTDAVDVDTKARESCRTGWGRTEAFYWTPLTTQAACCCMG
jgi:hypothetical protein